MQNYRDNFRANNDGDFKSFPTNFVSRFTAHVVISYAVARVAASMFGFWGGVRTFFSALFNGSDVSNEEVEEAKESLHD